MKWITSLAKMLPVDRLIHYVWAARIHSDQQIGQIAASVREFGFINVILVDSSAGVIAGQGRLLAARKLGMTEVPVIILDHSTEAQKRACILQFPGKRSERRINHPGCTDGESQYGSPQFPVHRRAASPSQEDGRSGHSA